MTTLLNIRQNLLTAGLGLILSPLTITAQATVSLTDSLKAIALPLLDIETVDHTDPTFTPVYAPEGCWGAGITDNNYVAGRMRMTLLGDTLYDSGDYAANKAGMRIKVRGNTSVLFYSQTPYKLKLSKKADLMMRGDKKYNNKNWALLSTQLTGNLAFTLTGMEVARLAGMPWEPEVKFVNVVLNGRYAGLYNLTETIERADTRIQTDESGFIIENDAYWWNEGEAYFKTARQLLPMGYTFKYPDYEDMDSSRIAHIKDYMEAAEEVLWSDGDAAAWLDYPSFARWVLAHDLLGSDDAGGTNMYYVLTAMDAGGHAQGLLQAGPLWDFGAMLRMPDDSWSQQHINSVTYYPQLFRREKFVREYIRQFEALKPVFLQRLKDYLTTFLLTDGQAIKESILLDNPDYADLDGQISDMLDQLTRRVNTVDSLTRQLSATLYIHNQQACSDNTTTVTRRVNIAGHDYTHQDLHTLPHGLYIERRADGRVTKIKR